MQYSFSQTFGRYDFNPIQHTSTPSFDGSAKVRSRRSVSKSRSRSKQKQNDYSPVIETYSFKPQKQRLSRGLSCKNLSSYISQLARQSKQYTQHSKIKQSQIKQKQAKLHAEIKNVDSINQRMANLIKQLRGGYDVKQKQSKKQISMKQVDLHQDSQVRFKSNKKSARCQSTENLARFKHSSLTKQYYYEKLSDKKQRHKVDNNKQKIQQSATKLQEKLNSKIFFQNVENSLQKNKERTTFSSNKKNQDPKQKQFKPYKQAQENLKRQQAIKGQNYRNNLANIGNKIGKSCGEMYRRANYPRYADKQESIVNEHAHENWLKNKVKTIESQMQTNCYDHRELNNIQSINQFSFVEDDQQTKQKTSQEESICMELFRKSRQKAHQNKSLIKQKDKYESKSFFKGNGQTSKFNSKQSKYESKGFDTKLKRISEKIEVYQKKIVELGGLSNYCSKTNFQPFKSNIQNICQDNIITAKGNKPDQLFQSLESKNLLMNFLKKGNSFNSLKGQELEKKAIFKKNDPAQVTISTISNNIQTRKAEAQFKIYDDVKGKQFDTSNFSASKQILNLRKKQDDLKSAKTSEISLKQRMSTKLCLSNTAAKIMRQIQLDQQFRKAKKQFSKLPETIPGVVKNKWVLLQKMLDLKSSTKIKSSLDIKKIFELTDEEADPFFSISVQNLRDYQELVNQLLQSFWKAESYFMQNLLKKLAKQQIESVFEINQRKNQLIMLDQLTLLLSNITKTNNKCRDVYLIFKRIIKYSGKYAENNSQTQYIKAQDLITVFVEGDQKNKQNKQTVRKIAGQKNVKPKINNEKSSQFLMKNEEAKNQVLRQRKNCSYSDNLS